MCSSRPATARTRPSASGTRVGYQRPPAMSGSAVQAPAVAGRAAGIGRARRRIEDDGLRQAEERVVLLGAPAASSRPSGRNAWPQQNRSTGRVRTAVLRRRVVPHGRRRTGGPRAGRGRCRSRRRTSRSPVCSSAACTDSTCDVFSSRRQTPICGGHVEVGHDVQDAIPAIVLVGRSVDRDRDQMRHTAPDRGGDGGGGVLVLPEPPVRDRLPRSPPVGRAAQPPAASRRCSSRRSARPGRRRRVPAARACRRRPGRRRRRRRPGSPRTTSPARPPTAARRSPPRRRPAGRCGSSPRSGPPVRRP